MKINKNLKSNVNSFVYKLHCLKVLREPTCLQVPERLFQSFAPLNEKRIFCRFLHLFFVVLCIYFLCYEIVDVLRSPYEVLCEFLLNKLRKYWGASSFRLLNTIVLDSISISSLIVFHPSFSINYWGRGNYCFLTVSSNIDWVLATLSDTLLLINQAFRCERSSFKALISRVKSLDLKHRRVSSAYMEVVGFFTALGRSLI